MNHCQMKYCYFKPVSRGLCKKHYKQLMRKKYAMTDSFEGLITALELTDKQKEILEQWKGLRPPLTPTQKRVYEFVKEFIHDNGYPPKIMEIRDGLGYKAMSSIHEHLTNLSLKGYIKREFNKCRGIHLVIEI